jgi:glycerate-2-kinase
MKQRVIHNFDLLVTNALRRDALALAEVGYEAINTSAALARKLKIENDTLYFNDARYALKGRQVFFVGIGKCALSASYAIEDIFGDRLTSGIALDVSPFEGISLKKIETYVGTHPLPSEANERATKRIIAFLSGRTEQDLVIFFISGGGSTLLCLPQAPMTCADESMLWSGLTAQGATIQEINMVRKHISLARGGGLAKAAYPAEVLSLIVSDVPGNDIEHISSGPTILDYSTVADAEAILARYNLVSIGNTYCIETPKEQKYFDRVTNLLFLTNQDALSAMQEEAVRRGYATTIVDDHIRGEARDVGHTILETLHTMPAKTVLFYAGETTVTLGESHGAGGRNQEMALSVLEDIRDDELLLPFASDGHDNTDIAGALGDAETREHARLHNLSISEYLEAHRSYDFFSATGDALMTGYTGSNVSDLIIAIKN